MQNVLLDNENDWSTKEKFILACCVSRSGDQNWNAVCRTMKLILESCEDRCDKRPSDFFSQKECAIKYNEFLNSASVVKRKSRGSLTDQINVETPAEQVLRKLTFKRIEELDRAVREEREKYKKLKNDMDKIQSGKLDDELPKIWQAIQSGLASPLEELIKDDQPEQHVEIKTENSATSSMSSSSQLTPSRPQRAMKETEKFKSYIEQRQKHNAKYHHTSSTPTTPVSTPEPSPLIGAVAVKPAVTTTTLTVGSNVVLACTAQGLTKPTVQSTIANMGNKTEAQGLLIVKTDCSPMQQHVKKQEHVKSIAADVTTCTPKVTVAQTTSVSAPTTPLNKEGKDGSFLSNLLASPAADIKAQVKQINEVLKEPIKNIHKVTKESYEAYKNAQAPDHHANIASTQSAPMLSKLLEVNSSVQPTLTFKSTISQVPVSKVEVKSSINSAAISKVMPVTSSSATSKESVTISTENLKSFSNVEKEIKQQKEVTTKIVSQAYEDSADEAIETTKTDVKTANPDLKTTKDGVNITIKGVKVTEDDAKFTKDDLKITNDDLKTLKGGMKTTDIDVKSTKPDVKSTKDDLKIINDDLKSVKADMKSTKDDINAPKIDVKFAKGDVKVTKDDLETTKDDVRPTKTTGKSVDATPSEVIITSADLKTEVKQTGEAKTENKQTAKTDSQKKTEPSTLEIDTIKTKPVSSEGEEPAAKKRAMSTCSVTETPTPIDVSVETPLKAKKNRKDIINTSPNTANIVGDFVFVSGRPSRAGSKKKVSSASLKIEIPSEEDVETEISDSINEVKDAESMEVIDDLLDRKTKTPLTPSIPSSPASPALSTGSNYDPETAHQQRAWRKSIMLVWKAAASHKYANVFMHPVTDEEAPGYSSIIFRPMDLSTIKKNVETGAIHTTTEFQRDIMLMFQNALMYNRKEHDVYRMAREMRDDVMEQIKSFIATQLMVQTTDRDAKTLRGKADTPGHTRQSSKSGFPFFSL